MAEVEARDYAVAQNLIRGDSRRQACLKAGYSESYVKARVKRIVEAEGVVKALAELGAMIPTERLGAIAKARLQEDLVNPPKGDKGARSRLGIVRTGLEVAGLLGGVNELHLHQHNTLPPAVQKMLTEKMAEMLGAKGVTIDAEPEVQSAEEIEPE